MLTKKYYDFLSVHELRERLHELHIKTLILTGVYTEVCVFATASRAFTERYSVIVLRDLVGSARHRLKHQEVVLELMEHYIAEIVDSSDILQLWRMID